MLSWIIVVDVELLNFQWPPFQRKRDLDIAVLDMMMSLLLWLWLINGHRDCQKAEFENNPPLQAPVHTFAQGGPLLTTA